MERYNDKRAEEYLQIPVADKTVTTDLSGDFTLPDYLPDIKRLLRVQAQIQPPSEYVGNREAELAGAIDYYALYAGSDNEIYCAPLTSEYKITIPYETAEGIDVAESKIRSVITPDMVGGRVTSPRKLNVKCRLRTRALILGDMPLESSFDSDEEDLEVLRERVVVTEMLDGRGEVTGLGDEMLLDGKNGDVRVSCAEGRVLVSEAMAETNGVSCRGDLIIKLMMSREDGSTPVCVTRKIPFTGVVAIEGVTAGCQVSAAGTLSELGVTVEDNRIVTDAVVILTARACREGRVDYVKDAFSTSRRSICDYSAIPVATAGLEFGGNFTLSDSVLLDEIGTSRDAKIIDVCGASFVEDALPEDGRCVVSGKARFTLLCEKEGEFSTADVELPFRYEVKGVADSALCSAEVITARARSDGERVGIDAEIAVRGSLWCADALKMPRRIAFGEEIVRDRGALVICYPSKDDSLWSVAKRYGVKVGALAERNGIANAEVFDSAGSLADARYLML